MSFTDAEKTDIRDFCGYGAYGTQVTPASGYRFFTQYGVLEYKLNNCSTAEETKVRALLTDCTTLDAAIVGINAMIGTSSAAVWTRNKDVLRDSVALLDYKRRRLCKFLGISCGEGLGDGGLTLVV